MKFLLALLKVLLLLAGLLIIVGGSLGSLCGLFILDAGITIGGALAALFGVGVYMVASQVLKKTREEAAEDYAGMVARHEVARAKGAASPDTPEEDAR